MLRLSAQVGAAYLLMLLFGALWRLFPLSNYHPELVVLWAAYLGVSARKKLSPSVVASVVLGYLADLVFGLPVGLMALICGLVCVLCHILQGRLLIRGRLYTMVFSFFVSLLAGIFVLFVRAGSALLSTGMGGGLWTVVKVALITGVLGPIVFALARWVDSKFASTPRERDAAAAGFWT